MARVPTLDIGKLIQGQLGGLGVGELCSDGEIGEGQGVSNQPLPSFEAIIEGLGVAAELCHCLVDPVFVALRSGQWFQELLEKDHPGGIHEVGLLPEHPTQNLEPVLIGPEIGSGLLGEIDDDAVRLENGGVAIDQAGTIPLGLIARK